MHIAGQGLALRLGGSLGLRAEGHQRISRRGLAQRRLVHAAQRLVSGVQHGGRGHGRAGQRVEGAAVHRVQTHKLVLEGGFLSPCAEAGSLGEVGVADGAARHQTVGAHAKIHRHRRVVAVLAGRHAVADDLIAVLGGVQGGHIGVARRNGELFIALGGHHRIEGLLQSGGSALLDRAFRDHVGQRQGHRGNQRDNAQDDKRRKLLLRLGRLLSVGRIVFHCTSPSITGPNPYT